MLSWLVDVKIAITNLRATRTRTFLTILGIVIGVASVTTVLALGEGAKSLVRSQITDLGDTIVTIRPGKVSRDEQGTINNYNLLAALGSSTITERDLGTVSQTEHITSAAPFMFVTGSIVNGKSTAKNSAIIATTEELDTVLGLKVRAGEFLSSATSRETVVLGRALAIEMLGSDSALGHKVLLRGQEFTVVGILEDFSSSAAVSNIVDLNKTAFIRLDAGKAFNQGIAQIQQINARVATPEKVKDVSNNIHQKLLANHGDEEDFSVLQPQETLQLADNIFKVLIALTGAVAAISIIVGGVGIMNIMLVSVTERTREIGIRKAVGATNLQICSQFLIEALIMTLTGGIFGIVFGYILAFTAANWLGFAPGFAWYIIGLAMSVSLGVGILFGLWPAFKAARKNPIEALRYFQ